MRVLQVISTLTEKEKKGFLLYLQSPLLNTNKRLEKLYQWLLKAEGTSNVNVDKFVNKEGINKNLFRKLCHDLIESCIEFLAIESFREDQQMVNIYRLQNSLEKKFEFSIDRIQDSLINFTDYYTEIDFAKNYIFYNLLIDHKKGQDKLKILQLLSRNRESFNRTAELSNELSLMNWQRENNSPSDISLENKPINNKYYEILLKVDEFTKGNNLESISQDIIDELKYGIQHLSLQDVHNVIAQTSNYCVFRVNKGEHQLYPIIFKLYRFGIENNIIQIDTILYRNIAYLASKAEEYDWGLQFVEEYKSFLSKDEQNSAYAFSKARIYANRGDWDNVIESLRTVEFKDISYNLNSKILIVTAYYELQEFEALSAFIKAFKVFLRRRRNIAVKRKEAFYDYTAVIDHLMKAVERHDTKRLMGAIEILKQNPAIPTQDWLNEKITQVKEQLGIKQLSHLQA